MPFVVIPLGFIGNPIVSVGVLAVGVPLSLGADLAVLVRHHDVGFPRGLRDELKGYIGEPPHVGFAALADLHKLEVAANDLVIGCIAISKLDDLPVLADLERTYNLIGMEVTLPRLALHHLVRAIGKRPGVRLGNPIHHLDGGAYLAGLVESAAHIHGVF